MFVSIGCDVSHPGPGVKNKPSIASLVASTDQEKTQYVAYASIQEPHTEIFPRNDLTKMLRVSQFNFILNIYSHGSTASY